MGAEMDDIGQILERHGIEVTRRTLSEGPGRSWTY
jgi:hypothetical protein